MKLILTVFFIVWASLSIAAEDPAKYENPADGRTYVAPDGWKTYGPNNSSLRPKKGKVQLLKVMILTPQETAAKYTTAQDISDIIANAEAILADTFKTVSKPISVLTQFECFPPPQNQKVRIASKGNPPAELLESLYNRLTSIASLKTTGPVTFNAEFQIEP